MNNKRVYFSTASDTSDRSKQLLLSSENLSYADFSVLCPNFSKPYIVFFIFPEKKKLKKVNSQVKSHTTNTWLSQEWGQD